MHPSPQVLGALARALRLTPQERDHLYRITGSTAAAIGDVPRHVTPGIQRVLDRLGDTPVGVFSGAWDLITWNPLWAALLGDPSGYAGVEANLVWRLFLADGSRVIHGHEERTAFERDLVADLRAAAARYPEDRRLAALISTLLGASERFAEHWSGTHVARHLPSRKTIETPTVGRITLDCDLLTVPGDDLRVVVYTAPPGTPDAASLDLLRVAGLQTFATPF
jgi:hypothetical protein